jgi:hypothetical protein
MMPPTILFCADPLAPTQVDPDYQAEATAAREAGFGVVLCDFERLVQAGNVAGALRRVPPTVHPTLLLYRGWMLTTERYTALSAGLRARGYQPITTPDAYRIAHELPSAYPFIATQTAATVWLPRAGGLALDQIMAALPPFGDQPVIVKDYVKSRKHEWFDACFIPAATDRPAVARVVGNFLTRQGTDLVGGLVFRAYQPFRQIGVHPQSGLPLFEEYRILVLDGEPLLVAPYWETAAAPDTPDLPSFADVIATIPNRFFTLDVARHADGTWQIVEVGDGQVAGLPPHTEVTALYHTLLRRLGHATASNTAPITPP